jgi:hypothetical protein
MPAADYQLFVFDLRVIAKNNQAFSVRSLLNSINISNGNQRTAVDSDKIAAELLGERLQRFIDQITAILVVNGYVFLICAKTMYLR